MMKLDPIQSFVEVVRAGGFTAAARYTGMPRSTVSLQVRVLEEALGVRLLKRSTRSFALTDEGQRLYDKASGPVDLLVRALDDLQAGDGVLGGLIRLTVPADFPTALLASAITSFTQTHAAVRFQIMSTNAVMDLVEDNIDIAVRVGANPAQTAIERRLLDIEWAFYASTSWLKRKGRPENISEVEDFISPQPVLRGYLEKHVLGGVSLPAGAIEVDSHALARDLMLNGFGVAVLPQGLCQDAVMTGSAEPLLPHAGLRPTRLNLTFPNRADMVPRVRAFADHICTHFR
ncbi:LysR family transcriptional regulator [Asaia krungthepensis]|uniref:LysR family transcriptional regulator n=1 Tax=Asaia krungthepensis NRIC 0535 TaxID=1307925 RepID=A0ABQ0Q2S8_9PROT|nr:LysR family transcriptional regulator [Asaia krungthepensis]GBQ88658.1 LysR family transcriptional regulator [Asaia krungthepensis NRIC 0535]